MTARPPPASTPTPPMPQLSIAKSVYVRPFGNELVLLHFGRGEYFALDPVGARVWRGIEQGEALDAIALQIAQAWGIAEEQATRDVLDLARELIDASLVQPLAS